MSYIGMIKMVLSKNFNSLMGITEASSKAREDGLNSFREYIINFVNISTATLILFTDESVTLIVDNNMFSFKDYIDFEEGLDRIVKNFPKEIEALFKELNGF